MHIYCMHQFLCAGKCHMQYLLVHSLNILHFDTVTLFLIAIGLQKDSPLKLTAVVHNYTVTNLSHWTHIGNTLCAGMSSHYVDGKGNFYM
jgi:hypothetical protein